MGFMHREITDKQDWLEIDGTMGTTWVPAELFSSAELQTLETCDLDEDKQAVFDIVGDYYEGFKPEHIYSVQITRGHGARLSAPGYMDCTDWAVFDTVAEAEAYLDEYYPEDEENEEE